MSANSLSRERGRW